MLSAAATFSNQTTGMALPSMSQSGVNVRIRVMARFSKRARIMTSPGGSSAMREPRVSMAADCVMVTPPPLSRRHIPQQSFAAAIESLQHIWRRAGNHAVR